MCVGNNLIQGVLKHSRTLATRGIRVTRLLKTHMQLACLQRIVFFDVAYAYVKELVPPRRRATYKRPASEARSGNSSPLEPPVPIHNEPCKRAGVSASHAPPERPSEGTGRDSSSAPGPQVNILIISMDAQRARTCKHALAQAGHVESVQARA